MSGKGSGAGRRRTTLRAVRWFPDHGNPIGYLVALVCWVPFTLLALVFFAEEMDVAAGVAFTCAVTVHLVPFAMYISATVAQDRSPVGFWALRAQVWLLLGGAAPQAVRAIRA